MPLWGLELVKLVRGQVRWQLGLCLRWGVQGRGTFAVFIICLGPVPTAHQGSNSKSPRHMAQETRVRWPLSITGCCLSLQWKYSSCFKPPKRPCELGTPCLCGNRFSQLGGVKKVGRSKKRKSREVARDRCLGWRLPSQVDFGWPALGCRKGRAPKSPERASGMTLAVQVAGHWGSAASGPVSRRVRRDSLVLNWLCVEQ